MLDVAAVGELYDELSRRLLVYFTRRTYDGEAALDLTAETFARVMAGRRRFRGETHAEAVGWVWGIAGNVLGEFSSAAASSSVRSSASGCAHRSRPTTRSPASSNWPS